MPPASRLPSARVFCLCAALILLHTVLCVTSMADKSYTYDERNHYRFGVKVLQGELDEPSLQRMPVTALNVVPAWIRARLGGPDYSFSRVDPESVFLSRVPTVIASACVALAVFVLARRMYGARASWLALSLYALSPNLLAHARLATNDLYTSGAVLVSVGLFWQLCQKPSLATLVLSALATGAAQLCKQSVVLLLPLFALLWLWRDSRASDRRWSLHIVGGVTYLVIVLLVINAGYRFSGSFQPIASYAIDATPLEGIASLWPSWLPVPLPRAYLRMTAIAMEINASGLHHAPVYLLGRLDPLGFWYYFPVAFAVKVPLPFLGMLAWAAGFALSRRRSEPALFLALPAATLFAFYTLFVNTQIGVRYLLPVLPLLHVFVAGELLGDGIPTTPLRTRLLGVMVAWYAVSSLSFYPHYLGYASELIGDRKSLYRFLADSNVDWGQNRRYLEQYLEGHADEEIAVEPDAPVAGRVIVRVNALVGIAAPPEQFAWLRENHEPIDHVGYSWLVFEVPLPE